MLNNAGIKEEMRRGIWAECLSMVTVSTNILVNDEFGNPSEINILNLNQDVRQSEKIWLNGCGRHRQRIRKLCSIQRHQR
jgi:hypothetical protein